MEIAEGGWYMESELGSELGWLMVVYVETLHLNDVWNLDTCYYSRGSAVDAP
jgi:hypothetical protein